MKIASMMMRLMPVAKFAPSAKQEILIYIYTRTTCIYVCTVIKFNYCVLFILVHKKPHIRTSLNLVVNGRQRLFVIVLEVVKCSFTLVKIDEEKCALWPIIDTLSGMGSR